MKRVADTSEYVGNETSFIMCSHESGTGQAHIAHPGSDPGKSVRSFFWHGHG